MCPAPGAGSSGVLVFAEAPGVVASVGIVASRRPNIDQTKNAIAITPTAIRPYRNLGSDMS